MDPQQLSALTCMTAPSRTLAISKQSIGYTVSTGLCDRISDMADNLLKKIVTGIEHLHINRPALLPFGSFHTIAVRDRYEEDLVALWPMTAAEIFYRVAQVYNTLSYRCNVGKIKSVRSRQRRGPCQY